ncbi:MAG: Uncharacterised protein [Chloroflexota bacterium]|nr:MAG: Uncharacterised protein [Chloroflexota bacterium]
MCWKVLVSPNFCISSGLLPVVIRPNTSISPEVTSNIPEIQLKVVDLPHPFGPIRPTMEPTGISKDTLLTAVNPPKSFTKFVTFKAFVIIRPLLQAFHGV